MRLRLTFPRLVATFLLACAAVLLTTAPSALAAPDAPGVGGTAVHGRERS